jgi:magnesium transporter
MMAATNPSAEEPLSPSELADAWAVLSRADRAEAFRAMPRSEAEDFFLGRRPGDQLELLRALPPGDRRSWVRLLAPDDVADLIQQALPDERRPLLELLDEPTRKEVSALLAYQEDEAGGLMSPRYARVRADMTVDEAVRYLRQQARAKVETIYVAYVLDDHQRLQGVVSFRDLFSAEAGKRVSEVMRTDFVKVTDEQDQETVSRLFAEHGLSAIPCSTARAA